MKRLTLTIVLSFSLICGLFAQNNPYNEVSIASPTAASLGKYADVPVSAHTGIPQISIPIYTIKEGPLSVPVSLSYHAGGLKVWETASWVGAGWSLNAGGVITRTVLGAPDERWTSSVSNQTHGFLSDSGYATGMYTSLTSGFPYQPPPGNRGYQLNEWGKYAAGQRDGEPDMFFFNVGGYSGKFFIRDDGNPVLLPEQDVRIVYNYTPGLGQSISSFILTTPDGTKYFFGKTSETDDVDPIERTNPLSSQGGLAQGQVISSWYLNKIQSADGVFTIKLSYVAESYSYYTISTFPIHYTVTSGLDYSLVKNMVSGVRLEKIFASNATVEFQGTTVRQDLNGITTEFVDDLNTQAKQLDVIRVYDSSQITGKKFIFNYDYFFDGSSPMPGWHSSWNFNVDRKRLKLLSIQEQSLDGTLSIPPTQFDYFSEPVPRRLFFGVDHWGFNNYKSTNNSLIPTYYFAANADKVDGANREPSWPEMRAGTLKKITYPTKGSAEYVFESNSTWVSFARKKWINQFGISAGFDGGTGWNSTDQQFTGETYKVVFTNTVVPSNGVPAPQVFLEIYRISDNFQMGGWVLEPQQSVTFNISYPLDMYRVRVRKNNANYTGYGATASFDKMTNVIVEGDEMVGGLRVKSTILRDGITNSLGATTDIETNYTYQSNGKSTGHLYARPKYLQKVRNDVLQVAQYPTGDICPSGLGLSQFGCSGCGTLFDLKSGSSIRPLGNSQGNHIGYNEVKISQTGNGYKILRYYGSDRWDTDVSDVAFRTVPATGECSPSIPSYPSAPLPFEYKRGELQFEGVYDQTAKLLSERNFVFNYVDDPLFTPAVVIENVPAVLSNGQPAPANYQATYYKIVAKRKSSIEEIARTYSQANGMLEQISTSYFESPFHSSPTRIVNSTSQSGVITKKIKYSFDYRINSCDQVANPEAIYAAEVNQALQIFNQTWNPASFNSAVDQYNYRFYPWLYYQFDVDQARIKYVRARYQHFTGSNSSFNNCITTAKNNADNQLKPIIELQQRNINVPIETTEWRDNKLLSATYNNYVYSSSPTGFVYPGSVDAITVAIPTTSFTPSSVSGSTVNKDPAYRVESSAVFSNGNIIEITPKNGVKVSYLWGYKNTLPIAKAVGVSYSNLSSAFAAAGYNLSQLRNQFAISSAMVNTYTYHPFFGMLTETDPNGKTVSYTYDKLQRLTMVRDQNNYILKRLCYGYAGQPGDCNLFYNTAVSGTYTRNNCGAGLSGTSVTYTVPAGTYASTISVTDANALAQNDVAANGQAYANANGNCVGSAVTVQGYNGKSVPYKVKFTNNATGLFYIFDLPANTWSYSNLGSVPSGTYTVNFYKASGVPASAVFVVNGYSGSGGAYTFYNVPVTSTTNAYMY
jgi:YD repeat-containing protein